MAKPMRIIFLDVDGVLNNRKSMCRHRETKTIYNVHRPCVARLNELCEQGEADCVLSSTWRRGWPIAAFQVFLEEHGFTGQVIDRTPCLSGEQRGVEIMAYLEECRQRGYPVESFVILDDDSDMGPLMPFLVRTENAAGLEYRHIGQALCLLETPLSEDAE